MSIDHQDSRAFQPPTAAVQLAGNNPSGFTTLRLPQTPRQMSPAVETPTPESRLAAALGRAIFTIPTTSFQEAAAATTTTTTVNPLRRTISDANSNFSQDPSTTTATPPTLPEPPRKTTPLRRTISDANSTFSQDPSTTTATPPTLPEPAKRTTPLRRALSDPPTTDYQPPQRTRTTPPPPSRAFPSPYSRNTPPESSTRKHNASTERLRKVEDMVREIEQKCWEVMRQSQEPVDEDDNHPDEAMIERDECVAVERLNDGGLRIRLDCACGKGFEILLKDNDYCFYRLT